MAQFDVYRYSENTPFVLDVQTDLLANLKTRVIIPLRPHAKAKDEILPKLTPVIKVKGKSFILVTGNIGALHLSKLKEVVDNVEDQRHLIIDALDFLITGF